MTRSADRARGCDACAASSDSPATSKVSADLLMEGLKRLEYRGYDSAGIA